VFKTLPNSNIFYVAGAKSDRWTTVVVPKSPVSGSL